MDNMRVMLSGSEASAVEGTENEAEPSVAQNRRDLRMTRV
jgi:hypothetical protein